LQQRKLKSMTQKLKGFAAVLLGLCGALTCPRAEAQLRSDLIESSRIEKEANLNPETAPKAEQKLVWAENSFAYGLLTGQVEGIGVGFGTIVPGSGFAIGPQYERTDLWGGRLALKAQARAAINESYLGRLELALPHLFGDRGFLEFTTVHRNISEMPYYGFGPDSRKTGRSDYRLEDTNLELRPGFRPYRGFRAGLIGSYLAVNVGPGHSTRYISSEQQFGPDAAPGILQQTNFWRGGGFVEYDWRDGLTHRTTGGKYAAQYVRYLDQSLGAYSFMRLDLDAVQHVPFLNHSRVITLHGSSSLTDTNASQRVPFYVQPRLGGPDTLRGYRFNRFYGNNSVMVNGEYRWEASPILDVAFFADAGKVFDRWEQWNLHGLASDVGFGLHLKMRSRVFFSFDTGFSHEGFQIWFRVNNML
jgi:outer membrane protein assembly factor BamA